MVLGHGNLVGMPMSLRAAGWSTALYAKLSVANWNSSTASSCSTPDIFAASTGSSNDRPRCSLHRSKTALTASRHVGLLPELAAWQ